MNASLSGSFLTGAVTIISVVVGNRLSSGQASRSKLWDLRREAYGSILADLGAVERLCSAADEFIEEDPHRYFGSPEERENSRQVREHMTKMRERVSGDYLVLTPPFIDRLEALETALEQRPWDGVLEEHENFCRAIKTHRPSLLKQGRDEILGRKAWWRRIMPGQTVASASFREGN